MATVNEKARVATARDAAGGPAQEAEPERAATANG